MIDNSFKKTCKAPCGALYRLSIKLTCHLSKRTCQLIELTQSTCFIFTQLPFIYFAEAQTMMSKIHILPSRFHTWVSQFSSLFLVNTFLLALTKKLIY